MPRYTPFLRADKHIDKARANPYYYQPRGNLMQIALELAALLIAACAFNIPLGYLRQSCRKFSVGWFIYVHISIPVIVFIRIKAGLGWQFIPFTLASTVAGQLVGGRLYKKRNGLG